MSNFVFNKWKYVKKTMADYDNDKHDSDNIFNRLKIFFYTHKKKDKEVVEKYRIVTHTCKRKFHDVYHHKTKKLRNL